MGDTSSTKEVTAQGTSLHYRWSFHEVIRAILRCLGLETEFHHNPATPKKEDKGGVNDNQAFCQESSVASTEEDADLPSRTDSSDPPTTATDPATDPPASTTGDAGLETSLSAPRRPGTSSGSGPQIN